MKEKKQKNKSWLVFFNTIKDYIFPINCLGCGQEGEWLCTNCFKTINLSGVFACPVCHKENKTGFCCETCKTKSVLTKHIAMTKYIETLLIGKVIQSLKYSYTEDIQVTIDKLIKSFLFNNKLDKFDYIVSIPLHKKRFVERGFNQAEIIAKLLAEQLKVPLIDALTRKKYTFQQAKLDRQERLKNIKDAFQIKKKVRGKILLVDDVFTTGSTLQEATKVLLLSGAKEVCSFSLARG